MPKQTGPKTAEGKKKSSRNALRHGLASDRMFVLDNETQEEWNLVLQTWTDQLQPRTPAELMIVEDVAHAQWKLRRARTIETGMIDMQMDDQADYMAETYLPPVDEGCRTAYAFKTLADDSRGLDHLHRYEVRARRAFSAGLRALEKLRELCPVPAPAEAAPTQHEPEPLPDPGTVRKPAQIERPQPRPVPVQRPAAQQHAPANQNLQNEMPFRARRAAIHRVRQSFGGRIPVRIAPPCRQNHD